MKTQFSNQTTEIHSSKTPDRVIPKHKITSWITKIKNEVEWVAIRSLTEQVNYYSVKNDVFDYYTITKDLGIMIEVLIDGHFGYSATCNITDAGIQIAFEKAKQMTKFASRNKIFNFTLNQRPQAIGHYSSPTQIELDSLSIKSILDLLYKYNHSLKVSDKIKSRFSTAYFVTQQMNYLSSNGSEFDQNFSFAALDMNATAEHNKEFQTRSYHGGLHRCFQSGAEYFTKNDFTDSAKIVAQQAVELSMSPNCPDGLFDLILHPDQMYIQIHEAIGHPLEYDRILGDERNFAGWSFVKPSDFGSLQYGSKLLNVTFDPTIKNEFASYMFDDCGNPAQKEFLIKDGILLRGLGSLESQVRMGKPGVANFRAASWSRAPIDRMANINIEPGKHTLEEMISSTESGIIMESNRSWSIDDYRRKFQFGCEYAQIIKNGKITNTVKNPNYRGVSVPFWNSLVMVGKQAEVFGSPYCGKGEPSQIARVGHASPHCKFKDVEVFGA